MRKKCVLVVLSVVLVLCLTGCVDKNETFIYKSLEDFSGRDVGCYSGTTLDMSASTVIPGIKWHYYDDTAGQLEALKKVISMLF